MIPTVFLDVDGVVSPNREGSLAWDDWEAMPYASYSILISRTMAARLAALRARLVWFTTWGNLANSEVGGHLGWPELDVVDLAPAGTSGESKVQGLRQALASCDGPVVVIDDDPVVQTGARELLTGRRSLLIQPDPRIGLTADQLDEVERFLASDAGGTATAV